MHWIGRWIRIGATIILASHLTLVWAQEAMPERDTQALAFGPARKVGRIESRQLTECSGMDASMSDEDLLWAINDSGGGPFIYALGRDGRDRGRVKIAGAENRDWEGLDTFMWQGHPMILIADFGDNQQRHATHTLYVVEEPRLPITLADPEESVNITWTIAFTYPDGHHDAEGVAVDQTTGEVLVLTKRDNPPLLFALPLKANSSGSRVTARYVAAMDRIPHPTPKDLQQAYGAVRSQPTAIDLLPDGSAMVVLTYKHAYLFDREPGYSWAAALKRPPVLIELPLPEDCQALAQREAICFSMDGASLLVTSEGDGPGLFLVPRSSVR